MPLPRHHGIGRKPQAGASAGRSSSCRPPPLPPGQFAPPERPPARSDRESWVTTSAAPQRRDPPTALHIEAAGHGEIASKRRAQAQVLSSTARIWCRRLNADAMADARGSGITVCSPRLQLHKEGSGASQARSWPFLGRPSRPQNSSLDWPLSEPSRSRHLKHPQSAVRRSGSSLPATTVTAKRSPCEVSTHQPECSSTSAAQHALLCDHAHSSRARVLGLAMPARGGAGAVAHRPREPAPLLSSLVERLDLDDATAARRGFELLENQAPGRSADWRDSTPPPPGTQPSPPQLHTWADLLRAPHTATEPD